MMAQNHLMIGFHDATLEYLIHMLLFVDNLEEMQWDHGEGQITKHSIQSTEIPIRVL